MPLDAAQSWITTLPEITDHPAAGGPPVAAPGPSAVPDTTAVIDVGPSYNPAATPGVPGSEFAPTAPSKPDASKSSWITGMPEVVDHPAAAPAKTAGSSAGAKPEEQSTVGGIAKNIGAGLVDAGATGANTALDPFGNLIGKPLATGLVFAHDALAPMFGGKRFDDPTRDMLLGDTVPQPGSAAMDTVAHAIGATPPSEVVPQGAAERIARKATTNAALMAGAGPIAALSGAGGALLGDQASQVVPSWAAPATELVGNIVGGAAIDAPLAAGKTVLNAAGRQVRDYTAPLGKAGQERLAAQKFAGAATDPAAVATALDNPPEPLVPGSQPTTFQMTGDAGLGNLERAVAKNNPDQFINRAADQNTARVGAIEGVQPTGDPDAVGTAFRSQLGALDKANEAVQAGALGHAQSATDALGSAPPVGSDAQDSVLQRFGNRLQQGLDEPNQAQKAAVSRLYASVDPDGTLAVDMKPFRAAVKQIVSDRPKNLGPLPGEAGAVFSTSQMQPAVQKFSEVGALRQRIGDAMAVERRTNGQSQTYRYLTMLRSALDDTLSGAAAEKAAADAEAVRAGTMAPESAIQARFTPQEANDNSAVSKPAMDSGKGDGDGENTGAPRSLPSSVGEHVPPERGQGNAGGSGAVPLGSTVEVGVPETSGLTPNFGVDALNRRRMADTAHAQRMQTFGPRVPGVGPVLQVGDRPGQFRMGASSVPANLFTPGKGGAERIQAFRRAAAGNPSLMRDLSDYAAFSFRRATEDPNGTINPAKAAKWQAQHAEVMGAFPDLAKKFDTAVSARAALDETAARHEANRKAYQTAAVSRLMGEADPVTTVGRILNSDTALGTMRDLARKTAGDPAAREGLRRAVIEHIQNNLRSNQLAGSDRVLKNDAFQTFVRKTPAALRTIFSDAEVKNIQNVAEDLQRSQLSVTGSKLPGGSNTAQDLAAGEKHGAHPPSMLSSIIAAEVGGELMHHAVGIGGKVAGMVAIPVLNALRSRGLAKVDDLVTQAMLHPALAKTLLAKLPAKSGPAVSLAEVVARQIRGLAAVGATQSGADEDLRRKR